MILLVWLVIGIAVAVMLGSFIARQGQGTPVIWNLVAGAIGGLIGGYLFLLIAPMMVGPGPEYIVSFLGAAIVSAVLVLVVRMIKK